MRSSHRARIVAAGFALVWILLAGRLVHLQWFERADLAVQANRQRSFAEAITARPGEIVDRHGRLLATTIQVKSLFLDPQQIGEKQVTADRLAEALDIDGERLLARLTNAGRKRFLWVKRRLTEEQADRVRKLELDSGSWGFRDEYLRSYPQGHLAAHVLGLRDIDGNGRGGIEQSLDEIIKGRDGRRTLVRDARGRIIEIQDHVAQSPRNGLTVVLTIDAVVQLFAERQLERVMNEWKPASCCAIVLDPQSGEVLAMASHPTFDPNSTTGIAETAWKNTAIASIYEPGSTFKPFVVGWALEKGVVQKDEVFNCEHGIYRMGRRVLHDHHPYGPLSVTDVLVKSSNIGMAKIGERLGNEELYRAAIHFGFGRKSGIDLPGELSGILRPLKKWNGYSTGSIPMGQEIAVTPLQLLMAHAALAGGGTLFKPRLVLRYDDALPGRGETFDPMQTPASITSKTVSPEIARWLIEQPMTGVVKRGTGKRARLDDFTVFGKTGTAQKTDPKTGRYSSTRHVCSFLCGAPSNDPQVLVLVVVDEPAVGGPHYGGTVAAPAAAEILRRTLIHLRVPSKRSVLRAAKR